MTASLGSGRKVIERATANVYAVDFIVDVHSKTGFEMVVTRMYCDRDIVCDKGQKIFRPEEVEFIDQLTVEAWQKILEQLKLEF